MKRKMGVFLIAVLVLVIGSGVAIKVLVKPEWVKAQAMGRIRAASGYAVEAGPASLKLGFSGIGIRVKDVRFASSDSSQSATIEKVDFYVKLFPLLKRRFELNHVVLDHPIYTVEAARPSLPGEDRAATPPAAAAALAIESWSAKEGIYRQTAGWGRLELTGLDMGGAFRWNGAQGGKGTAQGKTAGGTLVGALGTFLIPPLDADLALRIPARLDSVLFPEVTLHSGDLDAQLSGGYARTPRGFQGTLAGSVKPVSWDVVRAWIPEAALHGAQITGTFALPELRLVRDTAGVSWAEGTLEFQNVSAKAPAAPLGLTGLTGTARFSRRLFEMERATGHVGEYAVTLSARVSGEHPKIAEARVESRLPGEALGRLLPPSAPLQVNRGSADVDLGVTTPLPANRKALLAALHGSVILEGLGGSMRGLPLEGFQGRFHFADGGAQVQNLSGRWGHSDFALSGTLPDLRNPHLNFKLTSHLLDLDELMLNPKTSADTTGKSRPIGVPGSGTVHIQTLRVRKVDVENVTGTATLGLDGISLEDVKGRVGKGTVAGEIALRPAGGGAWRYTGGIHLADVPVDPLLGNWQRLASILEGTMTGTLSWDGRSQRGIDPRRNLSLDGDLTMAEGALENIAALPKLAQTFKVPGAGPQHWPFKTLGLKFQVREGAIQLERLLMNQAGLAWNLGGSIALTGGLSMEGSVLADPDRVALPAQVAFLVPYLTDKEGKIPIDFRLGGSLTAPAVSVNWEAMAQRAVAKAGEKEADTIQKQLEGKILEGIQGQPRDTTTDSSGTKVPADKLKEDVIGTLKNLLGDKKDSTSH